MKRIMKHLSGVALLAFALLLAPAFFAGMAGHGYGAAYAVSGVTTVATASGPTNGGMTLNLDTVPQGMFGNAVTQPTNPAQAQASYSLGQSCVVIYLSAQTPSAVNANTTVEQDFTVTGVATGSVLAISKPTTQAGIGIVNVRAKAANTVAVTYCNVTAGNITPTAAQNYWIMEFRGPLIQSTGTLTPAAVASLTTAEQLFTLTPATGQQGVSSAHVANEPGTYSMALPSTVPTTATSSVQLSPTNTLTPAVDGSPQTLVINKPTAQAGLGVANVRISDNNEIGLTFSNTSGAPITPTAEAYAFIALRGVSLLGDVIYSVDVGTLAAVNTITAPELTVACNGLAVGDVIKSVGKPTDQAGLGMCLSRTVGTVNVLPLKFVNPTVGNITPTADEHYLVAVQKSLTAEGAVLTQFGPAITAAAVATITGAEQTFAGITGLVSGAPLAGINVATGTGWADGLGGALPPGIIVGGVRVSATDTLAINFLNVTGASVALGDLQVTVLQGQPDSSGVTAGLDGSFVAWPLNPALIQLTETTNALQVVLKKLGAMVGS